MAKLYNLARMTTATTGTGTITLGAAVSGYLTFAQAGVANGDVIDYAIKDGGNSEHGTGTYTASGTTLTRTVTKSTNGNAAINLSGTAEVFISPRAETLNDGSLLTTGTVADARLSSNVPLKNVANSFSALNTFGGGLTVSAGQINSAVQNLFSYAPTNTGGHQFTSNSGSGSTIIGPPNTGMPTWFISQDSGGAGAAGISFHRSGAYAINVGLSSSNYFQFGGWSDGTNVYRFQVGPGGDAYLPYSLSVAGGPIPSSGAVGALNTAKAWVRYSGSTSGVSVYSAFNVSSVVRAGVGSYTINFSTALADGNYSVQFTTQEIDAANSRYDCVLGAVTPSASSFTYTIIGQNNNINIVRAKVDNVFTNLAFFR